MTTFSTGGSAVTFTTSGSAVSFSVTAASNAFTTSPVTTPGAHASTHGAGGADPITTLGTVTVTLGTVTTLAVTNTATFASAVSIATGNAPSPTLRFTGDTNTGIYSPGADQVGIATAGTARVYVTNTGLGVGVSPSALLHVYGDSGVNTEFRLAGDAATYQIFRRASANASGPSLYFDKARGSNASPGTATASDELGTMWFRAYDGSGYQTAAAIQALADTTTGSGDTPGRLSFYTTADGTTSLSERMRIDNAGLITGTGTSLGAWTNYTPTVTSGTGALTTVTANGYYCQIGKIVHLRARITLTTNGTGATDLRMTMPVAARNVDVRPIGTGRESSVTGKQLVVWALQNGSTAYLVFYDNTYPGGDGRTFDLSMTYEIN